MCRLAAHEPDRHGFFLLPLVVAFVIYGCSEDCSLKRPRIRQKFDAVIGGEHHWRQRRVQRKGAGCTLETPGSTCDLIGHGKVAHRSREIREIDAIGSPRDPDLQETSIWEAKYAPAARNREI